MNQTAQYSNILTPEALAFLEALHIQFNAKRKELLHLRIVRQNEIDKGIFPDFLPNTASIRNSDWTAAPIPLDIQDRRVEITGPVDAKMIINALNSGANVFMADFEDANSPTFDNCMQGQQNLNKAILGTLEFQAENGKQYRQDPLSKTVLMVRPRGWHLQESHLSFENEPASGSLVDFGLFFFHNAQSLLAKNTQPYFYLPKLESHLEARLWNDVFVFAQDYLKIPQGTIKATVLIETILATFEVHEIIYELRDHMVGLNCGRWDYIFSYIKKFAKHPECILPDRAEVTMASPFMDAYSRFVIQTCHRRGVHAMGGMSAFIPIKNDEEANAKVFEKVYADKLREVQNGHDGTWVAHPGLIPIAKKVFDENMPTPHQYEKRREEDVFEAKDFLECPQGNKTEKGLRQNIQVGILYIESWLRGVGAAAIHNLMEDAATAEISRIQVWQWIRFSVVVDNDRIVTQEWVRELIEEEMVAIKEYVGDSRYATGRFDEAKSLFQELVFNASCPEFLTLQAYQILEK